MTGRIDRRSKCEHCDRVSLERVKFYVIEGAWDRESECQVDHYLRELEASNDSSRLRRAADIAIVLEEYAHEGFLSVPRQLNSLRAGVHELKSGIDRLPFYFAREQADTAVRITHGFTKKSQRTPRKHIDLALAIANLDDSRDMTADIARKG